MPLAVATWNINSIRPRLGIVTDFLERYRPDVLCLQEIKCATESFPLEVFHERGYAHVHVNGQRGYHGVAVPSRRPFLESAIRGFCDKDDARHQVVAVRDGDDDIRLHNFYVPAGGDEPDPAVNPKFAHKLAFLDEMKACLNGSESRGKTIVGGDLNVAPYENDVWSHTRSSVTRRWRPSASKDCGAPAAGSTLPVRSSPSIASFTLGGATAPSTGPPPTAAAVSTISG